jgi:hypothetical protein
MISQIKNILSKIEIEYDYYNNKSNLDLMNIKNGFINVGIEVGFQNIH